jgi:hypothetical protein
LRWCLDSTPIVIAHSEKGAPQMKLAAITALAVVVALMWAPAVLATSIDTLFLPTTPTETLTALFTTSGATTASEYEGLVELVVSGFGQGGGAQVNDAFYVFESSPGNPVPATPLPDTNPACCSFLRLSLSGSACFPAPAIADRLVFIEGLGDVAPGSLPSYSPTHEYRFVIDLGQTRGRLTLGNMDCGFFDNTGALVIAVRGVTRRVAAPPFLRPVARCQHAIAEQAASLVAALYREHHKCLQAEADGKACAVTKRDEKLDRALASASRTLDSACDAAEYAALGFVGSGATVRDGVLGAAVKAATELLDATHPGAYQHRP